MIVGPHALGVLASQRSAMSYKDLALSYAPVAHWGLDETSDTTAVDEVGDHHGQYSGVTLDQPPAITSGAAVDFNGTDSYVDIGSQVVPDGSDGVSVAMWVYPRTGGQLQYLHNQHLDNQDGGRYDLVIQSDGTFRFRVNESSGSGDAFPSVVLGEWQFVAATWDGTSNSDNMRFYVNGVLQAVRTLDDNFGAVGTLEYVFLGDLRDQGGFPYDGLMDEVTVADRSLTETEVSDLYDAGTG